MMCRVNKAFTIIEFLSAMMIGLICIAAVEIAFMHHKANFQYQNALNALQENVRFSTVYLQEAIQSAGFAGCNNIRNIVIKNKSAAFINAFDQKNAIKIYPAEEVPLVFNIFPKNGTDVIVVHRMDSITANLKDSFDGGSQMKVDYNPEFFKDSDVMISDCEKAVSFHVQSMYRSSVNDYQKMTATTDLECKFKSDAEVGNIETFIFFIKSADQENSVDSLYVKNELDRSDELISGASDLKAKIIGNRVQIDFSIQSADYPSLKQNIEMEISLKNL